MMLLIFRLQRTPTLPEAIEAVWEEYTTIQLYSFLSFFGSHNYDKALLQGRRFKVFSCFCLSTLFGTLSLGLLALNFINYHSFDLILSLIELTILLFLTYENLSLYKKVVTRLSSTPR